MFPSPPPLPLTAEPEAAPRSGEGGRALLGLAQRVPLRETGERTHTRVRWDPPGVGLGVQEMPWTVGRVGRPGTQDVIRSSFAGVGAWGER